MTVPSQISHLTFAGDDASTVFPFPYYFFADADLTVIQKLIASPYTETTLVLDTDYSVAGAGDTAGGSVTLTAALASTYNLIIRREVDILQETDFKEGEGTPADTYEDDLDRLTMICQQLQEQIDREILLSMPTLVPGYLYSDGNSLSWAAITTTSYEGDISRGLDAAKAVAPGAGDIYVATDTLKVYVCYAAGTWKNLVSINDLTAKTSLVDNDVLVLEDSAATYALKKITRANLKADIIDTSVLKTGNQTIAGVKTFSSFPVTPSEAPTTDYQVANTKYVNDMNSAAVDYNAGSSANCDTTERTLATCSITTVAGKKVLINGNYRVTPHATVDVSTITYRLYRDASVIYTTTGAIEGADSGSAFNIPFVPINYIDEAAGSAATTYTLRVITNSGTALTIAAQLSVAQIK